MKTLRYEGPGGVRLDKFLLQSLPELSTGALHKYLRQNKIKLNGKKCPLSSKLSPGDEIRLYLPEPKPSAPDIRILYEDEQLLAVEKPPGISSGNNDDTTDTDTILARAKVYLNCSDNYNTGYDFANVKQLYEKYPPYLCHRIDTGTGGILLLAKNIDFLEWMEDQMRQKQLTKKYLCVTVGIPHEPEGILEGYLVKDAARGRVQITPKKSPGAKPVTTRYQLLTHSGQLGLLGVELITGRTHQIRAHLASIGTPILGDSKYGINEINRRLRCKYQCLFASEILFPTLEAGSSYAAYSDLHIRADAPWYVRQIYTGELHLD